MKVGVIGIGEIAKLHLNALKETNQEIVAICDIIPERCESAIKEFSLNAKTYENYQEMIDCEKLDAVHICTPHYLHAEMIIYALNKNVNVLSEKPVAISLAQLDEIEKASRDVISLFLQIFDNGFITDAAGRKISFRNSYVIMTSNLSAGSHDGVGFLKQDIASVNEKLLRKHFSDEFINRIDEIIPFFSLKEDALFSIAKKRIEEISERVSVMGISLNVEERVYSFFAKQRGGGYGARAMNRIICAKIENEISKMIVEGRAASGSEISIRCNGDALDFEVKCESRIMPV